MLKRITYISLILLLFSSCEDKKTQTKPQAVAHKSEVRVPGFNADSAYQYVKKQLDFGPRVPGSEAHAQCVEYFIDFFRKKTDEDELVKQNFNKCIINPYSPEIEWRIPS